MKQELKIYSANFLAGTFGSCESVLDEILGPAARDRQTQENLWNERRYAPSRWKHWKAGQPAGGGKFKIVQEELAKLQSQKNKFLEDLSLVRGKMQSQKTAHGRRRAKPFRWKSIINGGNWKK